MRIKVICPITTESFEIETKNEISHYVSDELEIEVEKIDYGTASIEGEYDEALAAPGILKLAKKAQDQKFDGVFISCMGDPAVESARELLDIPVVGPCRASMLYAADMTHKFSVVTVVDGVIPLIEKVGRQLGLSNKIVSVRAVDIPVLELNDKEKLVTALFEESLVTIRNHGSQAIILGCTGMIGVNLQLSERLIENGYDIPVIDPTSVSIRYLESLIKTGLKHSRNAYPLPRNKERNILDIIS
ncbi:MAG: aspartate/glutamate racemase family protein [Bacillota bacterium]|nr:aspartate/glutamate racemase family protein [Bacillota bacterium]